jgi:hypothetical protein
MALKDFSVNNRTEKRVRPHHMPANCGYVSRRTVVEVVMHSVGNCKVSHVALQTQAFALLIHHSVKSFQGTSLSVFENLLKHILPLKYGIITLERFIN